MKWNWTWNLVITDSKVMHKYNVNESGIDVSFHSPGRTNIRVTIKSMVKENITSKFIG